MIIATPLLCCDSCAFWKLSTLSDPSLRVPQLSVIIIQSRLPCPLLHLLLFFSLLSFHLCVAPCQPRPSDSLSPCLFLRHSSSPQLPPQKALHLSHHQLSHTVTFFTSVIFIIAPLIPALLAPPNSPWGVVWMQLSTRTPTVAENKPTLRLEQQTAAAFLVCCGSVPVLYHDHGHPVRGIHMFPNQVLEEQEWLHQEILQRMDTGNKECVSLHGQIEMCADVCRSQLTTRSEVPLKVSIYVV